jgi:hypothetical protein
MFGDRVTFLDGRRLNVPDSRVCEHAQNVQTADAAKSRKGKSKPIREELPPPLPPFQPAENQPKRPAKRPRRHPWLSKSHTG